MFNSVLSSIIPYDEVSKTSPSVGVVVVVKSVGSENCFNNTVVKSFGKVVSGWLFSGTEKVRTGRNKSVYF